MRIARDAAADTRDPHRAVGAPGAQELGVGAGLDEPPVAEDQDAVARGDGGKPMRRGENGARPAGPIDPFEEKRLFLVVERARRLVKDEDRGVAHQGAREGDALALPARERSAALADGRSGSRREAAR